MPDPVGACAAVRLPVRHGFAVGHPVDVCAVGRCLNRAVALRHHLDPIHFRAMGQFGAVLNVQVFKTKKKRTKGNTRLKSDINKKKYHMVFFKEDTGHVFEHVY